MQKKIIALIVGLSLFATTTAFAYPRATVTNNEAVIKFPESVTFSAAITSDSEIRSIILEYGNEQQTCGEVIAKAFPQFSPGKTVNAEWTWEMRQSGSLPPGASLWWRDAIVHELTHILVGHQTFSCLGDVPTWLNEGLAVYSEGEFEPAPQKQLDDAIRSDTLLTVRSLSGGFSEVPDKANLSYTQSYSLTKFLIETYGQEKMTELLLSLRDGQSIDTALLQTYGFDLEGLEGAWRQAINARPRPDSTQLTAVPTPTFVPTIVPVSGAALANQVTPTAIPTSSFATQSTEVPIRGRPPLSLTLILLGLCCVFLILIGMLILGFVVRNQNPKDANNVE